jgi:thioredoxin 1
VGDFYNSVSQNPRFLHARRSAGGQRSRAAAWAGGSGLPAWSIYRRGIMAGNVREFTDTNFQQEVLSSSQGVLVDFWAPWCGPCRMIAPMIGELANENSGSFKIGKINIDDNPNTAQSFGVSSIPTLIFFKGGKMVDRIVGVQPKPKLQAAIDQVKG